MITIVTDMPTYYSHVFSLPSRRTTATFPWLLFILMHRTWFQLGRRVLCFNSVRGIYDVEILLEEPKRRQSTSSVSNASL